MARQLGYSQGQAHRHVLCNKHTLRESAVCACPPLNPVSAATRSDGRGSRSLEFKSRYLTKRRAKSLKNLSRAFVFTWRFFAAKNLLLQRREFQDAVIAPIAHIHIAFFI
jgi:hypothetical protein